MIVSRAFVLNCLEGLRRNGPYIVRLRLHLLCFLTLTRFH